MPEGGKTGGEALRQLFQPLASMAPMWTLSWPSPPTCQPEAPPDVCGVSFDAAATIRGELFFFKAGFVWRLRGGQLQPGYPALASRHWQGLPNPVDAAFEDAQGHIWFFQGEWGLCSGEFQEPGVPWPRVGTERQIWAGRGCSESLGSRESKAHCSGHSWEPPGAGGSQGGRRIEGIAQRATHWPPAQR